ncbi:MAG: MBL fold metallo-hydrolase, partial [Planctomycetota bacterium]
APGRFAGRVRDGFAALRERGLARAGAHEDPLSRGLLVALLFGQRGELPAGVTDLFTRTGTRHLLALSGLHVALLGWLLVRPLGTGLSRVLARIRIGGRGSRAGRPEIPCALLILCAIPVGGGSPPVTRAALALALATIAPLLPLAGRGRGGIRPGRRVDTLSLFALALTLECLADPRAPLRIDVQLSYAATLGLIMGLTGARRLVDATFGSGMRLAETWASGHARSPLWRIPLARLIDGLATAVVASLVAVLATLPIAWVRFGEIAPAGVIATPLALPLLAALLACGWIYIVAHGAVVAWLVEWSAHALTSLLACFDRLPATPEPLPPRPFLLLVLGTLAWFVALRAIAGGAGGRTRCAWARVGALAFGAACLPWAASPAGLELVVLDVGHGTAVLVRAPGEPCWLFDAGSRDRVHVARGAVAPLLRAWEVDRLDVVLSHSDADHGSALPWLVERWPVRLWAGALDAHLAERLPHATILDLERGRLALPPRAGRGSPLTLWLLRGAPLPGNEGSRSLLLELGADRVLLSGDAEGSGLAASLEAGDLEGPFRVLLFPHHGSETPFLRPLLDATRPEEVWVSSSREPAVAAELSRLGLPWRWTGAEGSLVLELGAAP